MKKPICKDKNILNFKLRIKDCRRYKISNIMSQILLSQWADIENVVDFIISANNKKVLTSKTCYERYISFLNTISQKLIRHPNIQTHALNVLHYLKNPAIKKRFEDYHEEKIKKIQEDQLKIQQENNTAVLNSQTRIISQLEVTLENQERINMLRNQVNLTVTDQASLSALEQVEPTEQRVFLGNIKDLIFNYAVEIHRTYKSNQSLSSKQFHAMAIGLSRILDLGDDIQSILFSEQVWSNLLSKYTSRFTIPPVPMVNSYKDKWNYITLLFSRQDGLREARRFLYRLKLMKITESEEKTLDFFELLLTLRQSKTFMLDTKNTSKVSESDYVYQLWTPILSSIFNINNNIVRIKTGETVLEGSTEAKSTLYDDQSHTIGFKVDVRILMDFEDEEFDLVSGEGCLQSAENEKVENDQSKLLREGKEIEMALRELLDGSKENVQSRGWCIQLIGTTCHFSTVSGTNYGYHVNVPQFSLSYPSSFFDANSTNALDNLFTFRNYIEESALALKRISKRNQEKLLVAKRNHTELPLSTRPKSEYIDPNWYMPPHNDSSKSNPPPHTIYESGIESSDSDTQNDDTQDDENQQPDEYGFVRTDKGWYSQATGKTFTTHPYQM